MYDDLNRLVGVVDQEGNAAEYVYDAVGNILQIKRFSVDPSAAVSITLVSPGKGVAGTVVEIFGRAFSADPTQDTVRFNGVLAEVTQAGPTRLVTKVPAGATTGRITVSTPLGEATSPEDFLVLVPVTVTPSTVSVFLGGTQQFSANVLVSWAVNTIRGGNATVGTITAEGLYTAPTVLPTPSHVTVMATHQEDARLQASATVSLVPRPDLIAARPVSLALAPIPTQASPLLAPAVSLGLASAPTLASPLFAPLVSLTLGPIPTEASPLLGFPLALAREPVITGVSPPSGAAGMTLSLTLTGAGFTGATGISFEQNGTADGSLTVTELVVTDLGTEATGTLTIAPTAPAGGRVVRITTPGGSSTAAGLGNNVFTVP